MSNCASGVIEDGCGHKTSAALGPMPDQDNASCTSGGKLLRTTPEEGSAPFEHIYSNKRRRTLPEDFGMPGDFHDGVEHRPPSKSTIIFIRSVCLLARPYQECCCGWIVGIPSQECL